MTELISALHTPHALITLSVLGLAVVLFITGALAPELTGLLSLGLLLACGVLSPQEALAGFGSAVVASWLARLLRPFGDLSWNHPSHPSHEQRRLGRPVGPSGRATGPSPWALPFRPVNHRVVWGKPIISYTRGISNQPDGVRPRQVSIPRCDSLRLRTHIDHDRIDPCSDPLAIRLILTNTGRTEA